MRFILTLLAFTALTLVPQGAKAAMNDFQKVRLRSLDKITARTMTFDARVGTTIKFGSMYIKILACQKPDMMERDDASAFLQIWEITPDDVSKWIFSGWMFASSPAVSAMDHPIYDVWVIDCLDTVAAPEKPATAGPSIDAVLKGAAKSEKSVPVQPERDSESDGVVNALPPPESPFSKQMAPEAPEPATRTTPEPPVPTTEAPTHTPLEDPTVQGH